MAFHQRNRPTGYELAAINHRTAERIFICMIQGSRATRMTDHKPEEWKWSKKSAEGCTAGEWSIRFTGRTEEGQGRSIYDEH